MLGMKRTLSNLAFMSKAEQRKQRLLEIENEQKMEEAEGLKVTEEQLQTLKRPFVSVKFEFCDLDGLSWDKHASNLKQKSFLQHSPCNPQASVLSPKNHTFLSLTNTDLAHFSPEDTIKASSLIRPCPNSSSSTFTPIAFQSYTSTTKRRHRDGTRIRSPIKGLFEEDLIIHHEPSMVDDTKVVGSNSRETRPKLVRGNSTVSFSENIPLSSPEIRADVTVPADVATHSSLHQSQLTPDLCLWPPGWSLVSPQAISMSKAR